MKKIFLIVSFFVFFLCVFSQNSPKNRFRVMCYNVENLFDLVDDSTTRDEEYLIGGMRGWNNQKYQQKLANISKVIVSIGGWDAPAIVGLCEVESKRTLFDLTRNSGLKNLAYRFSHFESPDARGVDVALLYQPQMFKPFIEKPIKVVFPFAPESRTRDILYVGGTTVSSDSLHVFVCHFPSRLGGEAESEERRIHVAKVLRTSVDSILTISPHANIIIMGDFNDYPDNNSMLHTLKAAEYDGNLAKSELYNLMFPLHRKGKGTHKHAGEWGALDQFIVSRNLLNVNASLYTLPIDVQIFEADFLLEPDKNYLGKQPKRTYVGMKFNDGFSDHLPIFLDLWY